MTHIDFYILSKQALFDRQIFACQLTERALLSGHKVLLYLEDKQSASAMNQLLWEWKPEAFIPHAPFINHQDATKHIEPVMLGWEEHIGEHFDILINLAQNVPNRFSQFERLLEIVVQEPEVLQKSRDKYRFYKHRGFYIKNNDLRL